MTPCVYTTNYYWGGGGGGFGLCFNAIIFFFVVMDCGSLSDPTNGQVTFTTTTEGSVANYTCDTGYDPVGDSTRTCQSDEQWSGSEPTCQSKFVINFVPAIELHNNY